MADIQTEKAAKNASKLKDLFKRWIKKNEDKFNKIDKTW